MNTEIVTVADLAVGETGKIVSGKFAGREFRVRSIGTQGRLVMVDWSETATTGSIRSTTAVEVELPEPCADCAVLGWESLCDACTARAASFGPSITAEIERTHPSITVAEARARVLLTAQNTFTVGDVVRCTLPEFAGTHWSEPMTVEEIVPNNPVGKPVNARTGDGVLGAFSPADLELVR